MLVWKHVETNEERNTGTNEERNQQGISKESAPIGHSAKLRSGWTGGAAARRGGAACRRHVGQELSPVSMFRRFDVSTFRRFDLGDASLRATQLSNAFECFQILDSQSLIYSANFV